MDVEKRYLVLRDNYANAVKRDNPIAAWETVHATIEEANETAQREWDHLTDAERKKSHVYVGVVHRKDLEPWAHNEETGETDWAAFTGLDLPDNGFDSDRICFKIYQINPDRDVYGTKFWGLRHLENRSLVVDSSIYDVVYEGTVIGPANMELIFTMFNDHVEMKHRNFKGHSLSVSDVVEIINETVFLSPGFYFCDSFGFAEVKFKKE